jgi:hypothetical protein
MVRVDAMMMEPGKQENQTPATQARAAVGKNGANF